jgi:hypothetical protein
MNNISQAMRHPNNYRIDPVIRWSLVAICISILLLIFLNTPLIFIQTIVVVLPLMLAFFAGWEMYGRNNHQFGEAFLYGSGALILFASSELILVFFLLKGLGKMDIYTDLISIFQGLEFPLALFALAISTTSGIEGNVSIRNDLSKIKKHFGIRDTEDIS